MDNQDKKPLIQSDIDFMRILWCDNANIIRGKAVHVNSFPGKEFYVGISEAQQAIPIMYDAVVRETGLSPVGEIYLQADLSSLTPLPYSPGHGRAMGDMMKDGHPWAYCPRDFLKRMINEAGKNDLEIKGAFENEFYILRKGHEGIEPVENTVFASTYSMDINRVLIGDIVNALLDQGMMVEQYYPESGPGQQEITIRFSGALRSCDNQIAFRETVRAIANKYGFLASFLPKIFPDKSGSGTHVHMSLWRDGENILSEPENEYGLSETAGQFIAGVLDHLPALMAITTPITNSYRRIIPHNWCGAYKCWGIGNREAAIRIIPEPDHIVRHFEFKTIDASSNPYLALGSIIAAGVDGLENELELPPPVQVDPGYLSNDEMKIYKVNQLPSTLAKAISNLEKDEVILNAMGRALSKAYLEVKKAEWDFMKDLTLEDEVKLFLEKY